MGMFDGFPLPPDKESVDLKLCLVAAFAALFLKLIACKNLPKSKTYLRDDLLTVRESWAAARFDSLPHVVRILSSKDREGELGVLKEQRDIIEDVVDEVVHAYHGGFNKAIQNYSQILRLFSESSESIEVLKVDLAESKKRLSARNKQLHQLWYRSVTLRHIISLLDQIEGIAKVPARIEKLISDKQYYAAVQLHIQSALMLEREGLQSVGALQDIRSDLSKLQGILFFKILEDLHAHLYNKGEFSSVASSMHEKDDEVPTTTVVAITANILQPVSLSPVDGRSSYDGHDGDSSLEPDDERLNGGDGKDVKVHQIPMWLFNSTPDEFVETIKKSDAPIHVNQRLRPTVHGIITSRIKAHSQFINSSVDKATRTGVTSLHLMKGQLESYQLSKQKRQNGISLAGNLLAVSPVSPVMAPTGKAQAAAKELLNSILDSVVRIFGNHIVIGELIESKSSPQSDTKILKSMSTDAYLDSKASHFSIGFSLTVLQSECQQLICEILRATPEAASADAAVQTARLASKASTKEKRQITKRRPIYSFGMGFIVKRASVNIDDVGVGGFQKLSFYFGFYVEEFVRDIMMAVSCGDMKMASLLLSVSQTPPYQFLTRGGWSKKGSDVSQEGYGSAAVLPEQGMYLAASVYRPVHQTTFYQLCLLTTGKAYKQLYQASPAAFRPRAHNHASYASSIEKGRPVLQGLLAIDYLAKEASVLGWAQAIPKFAADLMKYVQTFLERTYERCRTSYMEAVLEKQSYMIIGRHDIDKLMRLDPASACLPNAFSQSNVRNNSSGAGSIDVESELSDLLLNLRPIRQENLIRDNHKIVLLASLSDSLEYVADSIERQVHPSHLISYILHISNATCRLVQVSPQNVESGKPSQTSSSPARDLALSANEYRKLAIDCLKVLRVEMQLETIFHLQEMTHREYLENQDAEEPDDFVISLTAQITRRDEEIAPFVSGVKRNYIFGGICGTAANASIKALADFKSINLFGVQQICRNSIALEQTLAAIPSIDSEAAQQKLEHALLTFVTEHEHLFTPSEYINLLKVQIPGREVPLDAQDRMKEILSH
ncbi:hypothetical protein CXB51_024623 [Gossypium anomalum]|uniref:Exocyst complex component Sec8 n=1 Tax=Gossypium anomalum TaxID=47600 RepID=A0A8J5Y310_9ROSI|nr:hypothetical protein CXB51_024623 [Gossypium anomalum]